MSKNLTVEEYEAQEPEACKRWAQKLSYLCTHPSLSEEKLVRKFEEAQAEASQLPNNRYN